MDSQLFKEFLAAVGRLESPLKIATGPYPEQVHSAGISTPVATGRDTPSQPLPTDIIIIFATRTDCRILPPSCTTGHAPHPEDRCGKILRNVIILLEHCGVTTQKTWT
jgi:hypothetical protein